MEPKVVKMKLSKETKGTYVFDAVDELSALRCRTIYLGKRMFDGTPPTEITLTVTATEQPKGGDL